MRTTTKGDVFNFFKLFQNNVVTFKSKLLSCDVYISVGLWLIRSPV